MVPRGAGRRFLAFLLLGMALARASLAAPACDGSSETSAPAPVRPPLVLLTLDTTRADSLGSYGGPPGTTPTLDGLASRGLRYARAVTPSPLTLPAHCSLLTGLAPPEHGVRDNGLSSLPGEVPTLATILSQRGYITGAFIASRVLDRRFGLDRGFGQYDDRMLAEQVGEYGYPERDAERVTDAALAWAARLPPGIPYFLWVHYYDPHSPYAPPGAPPASSPEDRYAGEIAFMDRQIGRLLAGLPGDPGRRLVAAVGDHGEMLGEHGERAHGIFLYRPSLEVPLILAGPGVPAGRVSSELVSTRQLAAALLHLLGAAEGARLPGPVLPGLEGPAAQEAEPVYSETFLPATAYGWSPLKAITHGRWRYILAPRPELYDVVSDPAESRNLVATRPDVARLLERRLQELEAGWQAHRPGEPPPDAPLAAALRSLGYLSGASGSRSGGLDPKDGVALLAEFEEAKRWLTEGRSREAVHKLAELVRRSPGNVPFLSRLGKALLAAGEREQGLAYLEQAVRINPRLEFLRAELADAYASAGRWDDARREYEAALNFNPRFAKAWRGLAETGRRAGGDSEERRVLERAVAAETESAALLARLAQLELAAGEPDAADRNLRRATELAPGFAPAWWLWGQVGEAQGRPVEAVERYVEAVARQPLDPVALLHLARLLLAQGATARARPYLERAARTDSSEGREARRLLEALPVHAR